MIKPRDIVLTLLSEGWIEENIAEWVGVNRSNINRYANGESNPLMSRYERMVDIFNSDRKEFAITTLKQAKKWAKRDVMSTELPLNVVQRTIDNKIRTVVTDCNGKAIRRQL